MTDYWNAKLESRAEAADTRSDDSHRREGDATMEASAASGGDDSAGPSSGGGTLALVDGLFLTVLSPAGAKSHSSPTNSDDAAGRRVVPAIPLHHVRSFLSNNALNVETGHAIGGSSGEGTASDTSCIASAPSTTNTSSTTADAASMLDSLMVDLVLHRHSHIQHPTREGLVRAYVDCEDGIVVQHDEARARPAGKHTSSNGSSNISRVVVSLKRPRTVTANGEEGNSNLLRVKNTAGSLTADFLGVGGLDQVLLIPASSLSSSTASTFGTTTSIIGDDMDPLGQKDTAKQALAGLVTCCALTDGTVVILPRSLVQEGDAKQMLRTSSSDGTRTLRLPSIDDPSNHWLEMAKVMGKDNTVDMDAESLGSSQKSTTKTFDEANGSSQVTDAVVSQQPWRAKLTKALHSRLEAEERATKHRRLDQEIRRELVRRSRRALEGMNASSGDGSSGSTPSSASAGGCKPAMVRLRYGTMPLLNHGETDGSSSLGISLNVCVDVVCMGSGNGTGVDKKATDDLKGLHISFSPASSQDSSSIKVKSLSGIVPHLETGDCISIMASVDITGLKGVIGGRKKKVKNGDDDEHGLELAVCALWSSTSNSTVGHKRGSILGTLKLSHEAMLLPSSSYGSHGRCLTHEVDWSSQRKGGANATFESMRPTAVFEYRDPRVITIDVTESNDVVDAARGCLHDMIESLNSSIMSGSGGRNRLELCYASSPPTAGDDNPKNIVSEHPRIVVLAQSPEERIGLVRLVLNYLPESTKIVGTMAGGEIDRADEQEKIMNALLLSIKREAKMINAHRRSATETTDLAMVGDLAATQAKTDEVASRIVRRG